MAARDSWAVQASGPTGLLDVEEARVALGALWAPGSSTVVAKSGFRPGPGTSPGLVTATGTPDAFVHVAPFQLALQTSRAGVGGPYIMTLDAVFDVNILSTPANATNPRDDLIIAQQSDTFYGDGVSTWTIRQVVGTPAGSPSDPVVSGSTDYVPLARVRVPANATTITSGNITDLRTSGHAKSLVGGLLTVALGGIQPVGSQAQRDAIPGLYAGLAVVRLDTTPDVLEIWDGSAWQRYSPDLGYTPDDGINQNYSTSGSTASATYVNVPGSASFAFVKAKAASRLRVDVTSTYFSGTASCGAKFGVLINGNDYDVAQLAATNPSLAAHVPVTGTRIISGVAAGAHTVQLRWLKLTGAGTLQVDTGDMMSVYVREMT